MPRRWGAQSSQAKEGSQGKVTKRPGQAGQLLVVLEFRVAVEKVIITCPGRQPGQHSTSRRGGLQQGHDRQWCDTSPKFNLYSRAISLRKLYSPCRPRNPKTPKQLNLPSRTTQIFRSIPKFSRLINSVQPEKTNCYSGAYGQRFLECTC